MTDITQTRLRELFEFDAAAGVLIWRARPVEDFANISYCERRNTRFAGTVAGGHDGHGYRRIRIDGKMWLAHRLIWIYANGPIPGGLQIDHINGKREDNRLDNLRLVTNAENHRNQSMPRNNTSGAIGVSWHKRDRKWEAKIRIDGRQKNLGLFETAAEAAKARAAAEHKFGFHPNHGRKSSASESRL